MTTIRPMLVCWDGSLEASHAIEVSARLLQPRQAVVVNVGPFLTPAERAAGVSSTMPGAAGFIDLNRADATDRALEGAARAERAGLSATAFGTVSARTWEGILAAADEVDAGVIVMGSRHLNRVQELVQPSVSHAVAAYARRPVFIVSDADRHPAGRALLCDAGALEVAASLLRTRQAVAVDAQRVSLAVAFSAEQSDGPWLDADAAAAAQRRAGRLADHAQTLGFETTTFASAGPTRRRAVAEAADALDAAVVVCADPAVAHEVALHTLRPVLLVPAGFGTLT
jgi:nucleotide-binding universal stress UspA family protein